MFETLQKLTDEQITLGARQLQEGNPLSILVGPREDIYVLIKPCPNHEVDFVCVKDLPGGPKPASLTSLQYSVIAEWAKRTIPALCSRWKEIDKASA